jgi:hypothetical protein
MCDPSPAIAGVEYNSLCAAFTQYRLSLEQKYHLPIDEIRMSGAEFFTGLSMWCGLTDRQRDKVLARVRFAHLRLWNEGGRQWPDEGV